MAKKRVFSGVKSEGNKKRSRASGSTTPVPNQNQERNVLNDGLLSLYKKELGTKEKSSSIQDQSFLDNKQREIDLNNSKTPSKTGKRSKNAAFIPQQSDVTFSDVGGLDNLLKQVLKMFLHYKAPELFRKLGIPPVRGILLHGPPGCGKTHIAQAIAGELEIPIIEVVSTELVCGISGESESKIRDAFDAAVATGRCILFIDEIDAVCSKRETTDNPMHRRMVVQMIKCLDELYKKDPEGNVIVIGATNMPDAIDPSLRRGKRFDTELAVGIPNEDARIKILQVLCKKIPLSPNFDLQWLAHNTPGYVGADLYTLVCNTTKAAFDRIYGQLVKRSTATESEDCTTLSNGDNSGEEQSLDDARAWFKSASISDEEVDNFYVTEEDFQVTLPHCIPNSKREGFASVPDTSWDDIGALEHVKKELRKQIMWPVQDRKFYERNKLSSSHGILLYGPKGCGKTLLAKAIANECGINFISVHGPELLNMYVGESEKAVRRCFERARNSAPCVIFFDEFDALCPPRSSSKENVPTERVVNQLLTETCGIRDRNQVFLIAATNRIEKIDSAMLRPGRLGKIIYVGLPTPEGRAEILKSISKDKTFEEGLDLEKVAFDQRCDNFSGADLVSLLNAAAEEVVEEMKESCLTLGNRDLVICWRHFDKILNVTKPSNSEQDRKYFEKTPQGSSRQVLNHVRAEPPAGQQLNAAVVGSQQLNAPQGSSRQVLNHVRAEPPAGQQFYAAVVGSQQLNEMNAVAVSRKHMRRYDDSTGYSTDDELEERVIRKIASTDPLLNHVRDELLVEPVAGPSNDAAEEMNAVAVSRKHMRRYDDSTDDELVSRKHMRRYDDSTDGELVERVIRKIASKDPFKQNLQTKMRNWRSLSNIIISSLKDSYLLEEIQLSSQQYAIWIELTAILMKKMLRRW